jgi:probable F420-dependent oxidoreductase
MHEVKFGLFLPPNDYGAALDMALRAERDGFYSVSVNDHFVPQTGPTDGPQLECFTLLTAVAAQTSRIRLAPAVACALYRTPAMLAKIAATLDHVSAGRLTLGIGAGWQRSEFEAHGYPFAPISERMELLEETLAILTAMWTQTQPTVTGAHLAVTGASDQPRPVQEPAVPLMLGGSSPRLLRLAARYADVVNLIPPTSGGKDFLKDGAQVRGFDAEKLRSRIALLRELSVEAGRAPDAIEVGGLSMLRVNQRPDDPGLVRLAARLGVPDLEVARQLPNMLLGTPKQVVEQLQARTTKLGVSYFILVPTSSESIDLFVDEVMPRFAGTTV